MASAEETPSFVTPQPEHKLLDRFAGEWSFEKLSVPDDGAEPETLGKGLVSAELVGGFFVVCRWAGEVYGADYKAYQSLGYDVKQKKYTGSWVDSAMSYRWQLNGAVEVKSKEFIVTASGPGPTGGTTSFRERYQFQSADSITVVGEMRQGEQWVKFVTTHLSRKR